MIAAPQPFWNRRFVRLTSTVADVAKHRSSNAVLGAGYLAVTVFSLYAGAEHGRRGLMSDPKRPRAIVARRDVSPVGLVTF